MGKIVSLAELLKMSERDNGEPLIDFSSSLVRAICHREDYPLGLRKILLRKSVAEKLERAQKKLTLRHPLYTLCVVEGYRHPDFQKRYFEEEYNKLAEVHPELGYDALRALTHELIAYPAVAGHPTGGAIDVTLMRGDEYVDMGTPIADFTFKEKIFTFSKDITEKQRENRMILHDALCEEGFAPFYGEWWHFSYGDKEWAVFYNQARALYATISLDV